MTDKDAKDMFGHRAVEQFRQGLREGIKADRRQFWTCKRNIEREYTEKTHIELQMVISSMLMDNEHRLKSAAEDHGEIARLWNEVDLAGECTGLKEAVAAFVGELGQQEPAKYGFGPSGKRADVDLLLAVGEALDDAVVAVADLPETPPVTEVDGR
ncbi:hypothetical protein GJR96_00655 [Haloferax sp. MBLA0076]|uniref:Uncharacterized protein n=1 Tax=Haloferax litoreum TaxID=2666140 RepID=A0A6A8GCF5_9EURY|nr:MULTISPECIES: hypothetical protein [Haloferax]KAB1192027.1 hypothetical protein Hfx1148_00655 [Haloferax sp. CBA1148]MRX20469.1 hypothetical protein [Haloferax litoreum]